MSLNLAVTIREKQILLNVLIINANHIFMILKQTIFFISFASLLRDVYRSFKTEEKYWMYNC